MFKKFIPYATAKSAYELDFDLIKSSGVKTIFMDIDNTLDSFKLLSPSEEARKLVDRIKKDFNLVLISNNTKKKITNYAKDLGVKFIYKAFKPLPKKINRFIKDNSLNKSDIILIGDQMMTDVWCGHNAKIKVILTEKIVVEDQWTTIINRIFERRIKKYHSKRGALRDWREVYGQK